MHGAGVASGAGKPIAEGKAGAGFIGITGYVRAGTLGSKPVSMDEVRCAAVIGGEVFSSGVDFASVPASCGAQLRNRMAFKIIKIINTGGSRSLADALTHGIVNILRG